jgi:hypothetical protein
MTDAEYQATKERVFALAQKWQQALGLVWWNIVYEWLREPLPASDDDQADGVSIAARVVARWMYGTATITVSLPALLDKSDDEISKMLVHEFMHIFLDESREADDWLNHEERVATCLTKAIFWALAARGRGEV